MNEKAKALGMKNTTFYSPHGLILPGTPPDVSTARDMAILSYELLKHPETTRFTSVTTRTFRPGVTEMRNHNKLLWDYPGCDGLKTGYTAAAGYSICATAERNGRRAIAVVVGAKSHITRNEEASALMSQAFLTMATNEAKEETEGSGGSASPGSGPRNQMAPPSGEKAPTATTTAAVPTAPPPPAQRHSSGRAILLSIFSFLLGVIVTATAMKLMAQKNMMFR
jgi:D-alanyl-D-alanine carboxypeptidase (penicillin-binding protein 5/6)